MNTSRKVIEWLICFSIANAILGCLLFKKSKKFNESCSMVPWIYFLESCSLFLEYCHILFECLELLQRATAAELLVLVTEENGRSRDVDLDIYIYSFFRFWHMKNKGVQLSHALLQNSEAIDMWEVTCLLSSRRVVVCDDYPF